VIKKEKLKNDKRCNITSNKREECFDAFTYKHVSNLLLVKIKNQQVNHKKTRSTTIDDCSTFEQNKKSMKEKILWYICSYYKNHHLTFGDFFYGLKLAQMPYNKLLMQQW